MIIFRYSKWLAILWTVLIIFLTLLPGKAVDLLNLWGMLSFDKLGHLFLYSVYTFFLAIYFQSISKKSYFNKFHILKAFLISVGLGTAMEYLQSFIPERNFDFLDMLANFGGAIIGILAVKLFLKIQTIS